jgi:Malectin domain
MTAKSSTSLDMERAELQTVLESELFTRAPTLAHLLSYLCEKSFSGESSSIKEYSVGIDVFHRGPDFDQESDSIVRVQANRLRKRLAEYYADKGAAHELRITIPIGQYVPVFEAAGHAQEAVTPAAKPPLPVTGLARARRILRTKGALWAGVVVWLLAAVAVVFWSVRRPKPGHLAPATVSQAVQQPPELVGLPMGDELRILAGASRSYVDHAGKLWTADTYFTGGSAVKSEVQHIWRTQDPSFYRTSRQGEFHYDVPLKKGVYELRLHFAENFYGPENIGSGGEGSRMINVRANGKPLLANFDVVTDAGASGTADVKVFTDIAPADDGKLHLEFSSSDGGKAMLSAIEVLPGARGRIRPVRILARQGPYYSNDSHWWSPDAFFKGGQLATDTTPVRGTDDPELYESRRWGNFSYAIPVTPGHYSLTLYFSARPIPRQSGATAGEQTEADDVFNVFCNGKAILENFDLRQADGDIVVRHFTGLEPDAQGKLLLEFMPVKGYATVTGIEVLPQ